MKSTATLLTLTALAATGCQSMVRPELTPLNAGLGTNSQMAINTPVAIPQAPKPAAGALWVPGSRQFFKDSRARTVGDIVTVVVNESATAKTEAKTDASRDHTQRASLLDFLNLEGKLKERGIPTIANNLVNSSSNRDFQGDGKTDRKDSLTANIAAVVTQVLPNGLLVIQGQREVVVNYEKQVLILQGMVRPEDITAQNTISSQKIAEARIAYAGKGMVDEAQTPQYGVRMIDKILPF
ncbi:MAG: flagellar basal body L-ring protein FlgH [Proteobacteria bacterium]|nr:flagellar basal body L-ring protein FlgH [Pseudomonadota bacterium]NBX86410.1 flagellar basal body L-ring protein FlgH [Pseudomonadota bacterium]